MYYKRCMPKPSQHKPRSLNHPAIVEILKSLNRICLTPHANKEEGVLDNAMGMILGTNCGGFYDGVGWTAAQIREVTLAFALHVPPALFKALQEDVRKAREFVEYWDERGWIDANYNQGPERDRLLALHGLKPTKVAA